MGSPTSRWSSLVVGIIGIACVVSCGCLSNDSDPSHAGSGAPGLSWLAPRITVPAGTSLTVRLTSGISSKSARPGDGWTGVLTDAVMIDGRSVLPAGTTVRGVVAGVREAERGNRAMLDLAIRSVQARDHDDRLIASAEPVVAGSPRARNLGAIAGGVAAGAVLGKVLGGDGHDAAVGGVIGGTAATGAVLASRGYQVELKSGTVMHFTVSQPVAMRVEG